MKTARNVMNGGLAGVGEDASYYGSCISETFLDNVKTLSLNAGVDEYFKPAVQNDPLLSPDNESTLVEIPKAVLADVPDPLQGRPATHNSSAIGRLLSKHTRKFSHNNLGSAQSVPTLQLSTARSEQSIDYEAVWNSTLSDCAVMSAPLRHLLRTQKKHARKGALGEVQQTGNTIKHAASLPIL
jgi:hypothetical protein